MNTITKYSPLDIVMDAGVYRANNKPREFVDYLEGKMTVKILKDTRDYCLKIIEDERLDIADELWTLTAIEKVLSK